MTQTFFGTLVVEQCCSCHVHFGMTQELHNRRRQDHQNFTCPNGHGQHYTAQTEAERLAKELEASRKQRDYWFAEKKRVESEKRSTIRALNATKGWLHRTKRRIANGVCPCCNRSFKNLHRHMTTQHKDYTEAV